MDELESLSHTRNGTANVTWTSFQSAGGRRCTPNRDVTWRSCSGNLQHRKNPRFWRASAADHVHMMMSSPEICSVSGGRVHGYFVSTIGRDEQAVRAHIRHQEQQDKHLEQLNLWC